MRVEFIAQAGVKIHTAHGSILCDPWFNPAYYASWFPYPRNDLLDHAALGDTNYLYISHLHRDHFDPEWLAAYCRKDATVILPAYPLPELEEALRGLGFTSFIRTTSGVPVQHGGLTLVVESLTAPTDGPIGDSALLVDDGEERLLNLNDSRPTDPDRLLVQGPIDICLLQFSGAIWYPMVYELPAKAREALARKKRAAQLTRAARYVELIAPRVVIPSAGPPCFLDDELFRWNDIHDADDSIFPDQRFMVQRLTDEGHQAALMLPGSVGAFDAAGMFRVEHLSGVSSVQDVFANKETYLRRYAADWAPRIVAEKVSWSGPRSDLLPELKAWFEPLMALGPRVCDGIGATVRIATDDASILLDFPDRAVIADDGREVDFKFTIPRLLLDHLVRTRTDDWVNSLFLSMRFSAWRRGAYNDYLYTWFKCLSVARIQYAEGFYAENGPTEGTFDLSGWQVQRRCPHMKADLTRFGTSDGSTLTCSIHGWQWDLATGRCLTSDGHPLFARPQSDAARDAARDAAQLPPPGPDPLAGGPEGA